MICTFFYYFDLFIRFRKDDYSLKVAALPCLDVPLPEPIKADSSKPAASKPTSRKKTESTDNQPTLFEEE